MRYFISTILSFVKKVWPTFKPGIVMTAGLKFTFSPNDNFLLIVIVQNYIPLIVQIKKSFLFFQTALVLSKPDSRGIKCNHGRGDSPVVSWNQKEANLIVIRSIGTTSNILSHCRSANGTKPEVNLELQALEF